jgi:hypothetical protein
MDTFNKHYVDYHLYADDTQFDHTDPEAEMAARLTLSRVSQDVENGMASHSLKLNPSKTVVLPVSRHLRFNQLTPLELGPDCTISPVEPTRNLGISFDTALLFRKQITEVRKSAFFHLRSLSNIRGYLPADSFASSNS